MAREKFVDVHFARPPFGPFTYGLGAEPPVPPGCRLEVELGPKLAVGFAGRYAPPPSPHVKIKKITRVLDYDPVLPLFIWELLEYVARRYAASVGEAASLALPVPLDLRRDDLLILTPDFAADPALDGLTDDEQAMVRQVWSAGWLGVKAAGRGEIARRLCEKNVLALEPYAARPPLDDLLVFATPADAKKPGKLGQAIAAAAARGPVPAGRYWHRAKERNALRRLLRAHRVALALVSKSPSHPSPKAEAALITGGGAGARLDDALARAREAGSTSALVIVPEMYRVPAVRRRCEELWGGPFEPYYSEMSPAARWEVFRRCRRGTVACVVGTRSALFLPLPRDAAIVVIDEADNAYKQWERAPYYHARDVAAARAAASFAMTAASPSLEAYARALSGDAALRRLPPQGSTPALTLVDMAKVAAAEGPVILSAALVRGLQETLAAGKRALVMVNRRGYVPYVYCDACGASLACRQCDVAFTYHKDEEVLRCHYCMRREPLPRRCPSCGKEKLTGVGFGTEKLAAEVKLVFDAARVARVDSDALRTPAQARQLWRDFAAGAYDVAVGTQMALRALDDDRVAFAALANADTAMSLPDFRASEQTFRTIRRMLEPTAARRRVLIQTFYPGHYAIAAAAADDYGAFAERELAFRRRLELPPYTHLVNVVVTEKKAAGRAKGASTVEARLGEIFGPAAKVLGPMPAPVARARGERRWQILVKAPLPQIEKTADKLAALVRRKGPVEVKVDVDPYELF